MMPDGRLGAAACVLVFGLFGSGCQEDFGTSPTTPSAIDALDGGDQTGQVASTLPQPLVARVTGSDGRAIAGAQVSWSVESGDGSLSSPSTTTDGGGITQTTWTLGTGAGEQTVRATVSGASGSAGFAATALPGPMVSVGLSHDGLSFDAFGQTTTLAALGEDQYGNEVSEADGTWSSTDPTVASVTSAGLVTAEGNGTAQIRFTHSAGTETAGVEVAQEVASVLLSSNAETLTGIGATVTLSAIVEDANHNTVADAVPIWTSRDPSVATVDMGLVTAVEEGSTWVVAEAGTQVDSAEITVTVGGGSVATVTVSPDEVLFEQVGATLALTAEARDGSGEPVGGVGFSWSSSNTAVVTVDGSGVATAEGEGVATITASVEGVISNEVVVTVDPVAETVVVSPGLLVLSAGGEAELEVQVLDAGGTIILVPEFTTQSRAGAVVIVDGTTVRGVAPGVADVVATSDGAMDSARVAVVAQDGFALVATMDPAQALMAVEPGSTIAVDLWLIRPEGGTGGLGSISGTLNWNPETLEYDSSTGLAEDFAWTPNETDAAAGTLTFGSFAAQGRTETFALARVTFTVLGVAGWASELMLDVSAAGDAEGENNIKDLIQTVNSFLEVQP